MYNHWSVKLNYFAIVMDSKTFYELYSLMMKKMNFSEFKKFFKTTDNKFSIYAFCCSLQVYNTVVLLRLFYRKPTRRSAIADCTCVSSAVLYGGGINCDCAVFVL